MSLRARQICGVVIVMCGLLVWWSKRERPSRAVAPSPPIATPAEPRPVPPRTAAPQPLNPDPAAPPAPGGLPADPDAAQSQILAELDELHLVVRDFRMALGGNPIGNNAEIVKALLGDNLKQVKLPLPAGTTLNGEGELCDRWGTPFFFHQLSREKMEIRSAGPDRKMWTGDDHQQ